MSEIKMLMNFDIHFRIRFPKAYNRFLYKTYNKRKRNSPTTFRGSAIAVTYRSDTARLRKKTDSTFLIFLLTVMAKTVSTFPAVPNRDATQTINIDE